MSFPIVEIFGFPPNNHSDLAERTRSAYQCPFLEETCIKEGHDIGMPLGTCTVTSPYGPVVTCPKRFYGKTHALLDKVAAYFFDTHDQILRIPEVGPNQRSSLDWILAEHDSEGNVLTYHGVEVQAIDITGSVKPYFRAYMEGEDVSQIDHRHGINWANVFKRMMPQVLAKGAMLASYGKKLGVLVQDQLLDYMERSKRMRIEREPNPDLANIVFFSCTLQYDEENDIYTLEMSPTVLPSSSRRLETAFIQGLLGGDTPRRTEFEALVQQKVAERLT